MSVRSRGFNLLCLFATLRLAPSSAAVTRKSAVGAASGRRAASNSVVSKKWGPEDLGLGAAGDLAPPQVDDAAASSMINVPGEGTIQDEMVALQHPSPERPPTSPSWSPMLSSSSGVNSLSTLATAQSQGLISGAMLESKAVEQAKPASVVDAHAQQPKVVDEYDIRSDDEDDDDDYRTIKVAETSTKEELERQASGDVEHVQQKHVKRPPLLRRAKVAAAVEERAEVKVNDAGEKSAAVVQQPPGNGKMMAQCMAFAGWVKSQGSTGPDLVRIWKGTCMPAVMGGSAPPNYNNMCNALGAAVGKFAAKPWTPPEICQAVLHVFKESGVGSTPLAG